MGAPSETPAESPTKPVGSPLAPCAGVLRPTRHLQCLPPRATTTGRAPHWACTSGLRHCCHWGLGFGCGQLGTGAGPGAGCWPGAQEGGAASGTTLGGCWQGSWGGGGGLVSGEASWPDSLKGAQPGVAEHPDWTPNLAAGSAPDLAADMAAGLVLELGPVQQVRLDAREGVGPGTGTRAGPGWWSQSNASLNF